jgi:hypothetical protein
MLHSMRDLRGAPVEILRDEPEFVLALDFRAGANVAGHQALGEFRQLIHGLEHALIQHVHNRESPGEQQGDCAEQGSAGGCRQRTEFEQG